MGDKSKGYALRMGWLLLFVWGWVACAPAAAPPPTVEIGETIVQMPDAVTLPPTLTPPPTATPSPPATAAAAPTLTPTPTETPAPSPTPTPDNPVAPIGQLELDEIATAAGSIVAVDSFSRGYKFTLDDGSGQIVLLLWDNVYDECENASLLNLGAEVQASGRVGEFEGERQLTPARCSQVSVLLPPAGRPAATPISQLGNYVGQRVTIAGQVTRVQEGSHGDTFFIADESGEIALFIWHNTLERIPNHRALRVPGTRLEAVGVVSVFRNVRQLTPVLPVDVEITP